VTGVLVPVSAWYVQIAHAPPMLRSNAMSEPSGFQVGSTF
jgi:hypothetical protein